MVTAIGTEGTPVTMAPKRAVRELQIEGDGTIGKVFPADDPVARFVVAMAMAQNDIRFAAIDAAKKNDADHPRFRYMARLSIAHTYEAVYALSRWREKYPEIREFIKRLPADAQDDLKQASKVIQQIGEGVLEHSRNRTFHYPYPDDRRNPDSDAELTEILEHMQADPTEVAIEYQKDGSEEYDLKFADDVATLATFHRHDPKKLKEQFIAARDGAGAFSRFVDGVVNLYMDDRNIEASDPEFTE